MDIIQAILMVLLGSGVTAYVTLRRLPSDLKKNSAETDHTVANSAESVALAAEKVISLYENLFTRQITDLTNEVHRLREVTEKQSQQIQEQSRQVAVLSVQFEERQRLARHLLFGIRVLIKQVTDLGHKPDFMYEETEIISEEITFRPSSTQPTPPAI